jgi:hypothetical protein
LLLVAIVMATVSACGSDGTTEPTTSVVPPSTAEPAVTTTEAPTTTVETAETASFVVWDRQPFQETLAGGFMNAVTVTPTGIVAVGGWSAGYLGRSEPAVWTSSNGRDWDRIASPAFALSDDESTGVIFDVIAFDAGIVAVGYEGSELFEVDAAVWTSTDGVEWERVADPALGGPGLQAMKDITVIENLLVATGSDGPMASGWYSSDGVSWSRATGLESSLGVILDVAVDENQVVAVGYHTPSGWGNPGAGVPAFFGPGVTDLDVAIWLSADGRSWRDLQASEDAVLPIDPTMSDGALAAVTTRANGFVAFGIADDLPILWSSPDGFSWEEETNALPRVLGTAIPTVLYMDDAGFLVTAYSIDATIQPHFGRAYAWTSGDGNTWENTFDESIVSRTVMLDAGPSGGIVDVVEFDGTLIGVGHIGVYGDPGEFDTVEFCGGGGSEAPSCRTDATVWTGAWTTDD